MQALYARHLSTQLDRRHLYEVITEGTPCHAYLDLEYSTAANPGVRGDSLVNRLVLLLMAAFRERWGITLRKQVSRGVFRGVGCVFRVCGDSRLVLLLMAAYRERWGITLRKQV
jgi:hypothetical protein